MRRICSALIVICALLVFAIVAAAQQPVWGLELCDGVEGTLDEPGVAGSVTILGHCPAVVGELEEEEAIALRSPLLSSSLGWRVSFVFDWNGSVGVMLIELRDPLDALLGTVVVDAIGCGFVPGGQVLPKSFDAHTRVWQDKVWWLEGEHRIELRYHVPGELSVRFDWNYVAFSFEDLPLEHEAFLSRIRIASDEFPQGEIALEVREFEILGVSLRGRW